MNCAQLHEVRVSGLVYGLKFHQPRFVIEQEQDLGIIGTERTATESGLRSCHVAEDTESTTKHRGS